MYLKIKKAKLVQDRFGKHIAITMVGLYDSDGKRTKRVKLNDVVLEELLKAEINITVDEDPIAFTPNLFDNGK